MLNRLISPPVFIAAAYLLFCFWYTNTGGPLTSTEVDAHLAQMKKDDAAPQNLNVIEDFMRRDTGNQFVMVNLIDLNPTPPNLPATGPGADPMALVDHYMAHMYPTMFLRASHPIFLAPVQAGAMDLLNAPGETLCFSYAALFVDGFSIWSRTALIALSVLASGCWLQRPEREL